ncbi:MAG: SagB/ThcOx family dehydrogenase [Planctomycetia bacterium]|nr:SagB/ThcOx family dehydrogenase [Planctomycetia bacterium]
MQKFLTILAIGFLTCGVSNAVGQSASGEDIYLPEPTRSGGKPVMDAISERGSAREFADQPLDAQTLSDILWSAWGFNREGKRTVPSAHNRQEMEVYVILAQGAYKYDATKNALILVAKGDFRKDAGTQEYVHDAPLNIIYVGTAEPAKRHFSFVTAGCAVENVYLYAASKGLACVVRASFSEDALKKTLNLSDNAQVMLGQTVGYPQK